MTSENERDLNFRAVRRPRKARFIWLIKIQNAWKIAIRLTWSDLCIVTALMLMDTYRDSVSKELRSRYPYWQIQTVRLALKQEIGRC